MKYLLLFLLLLSSSEVWAQSPTPVQNLRGIIFDRSTEQPLTGAKVEILGADPLQGGYSDAQGKFSIQRIPVGRYEVKVSYLGYQSILKSGVLLHSGQETYLELGMDAQALQSGEVVIEADQRKVTNVAAMVSARSFSVEELRRIPGGVDDPARMAVKFPGISPNPDALNNQLNVRGNSPRGVIWRLEGVDIYNPNHFARLGGLGGLGGSVTLFSQQLLANTDFFSGAFPADYGNAIVGVFDARFRNGNTQKRQHAFQLSIIGIDFSTEGPFNKNGNSSYLANYRYSTTGIIKEFVDVGAAIPTYQDLSFKLHFRLPNQATLDVFGIGGISESEFFPSQDTSAWSEGTRLNLGSTARTTTGTIGVSYAQTLGSKSFLKSTLVGTGINYDQSAFYLQRDLTTRDSVSKTDDYEYRISWATFWNHTFGPRHTHRTGVAFHGLASNVFFIRADNVFSPNPGGNLNDTIRQGQGETFLLNAYTRSQFILSSKWQLNAGLHFVYFGLTGEVSLEPRMGLQYRIGPRQSLSLGYGLHSQTEPFFTYLIEVQDENGQSSRLNDDLLFNKAHHVVLSYRWQISEKIGFVAEMYHQEQFNMVVAEDLPISRVGGEDFFFETFDLNNGGKGRNTGLELALERIFANGYYFIANTSLFRSTYMANDQVRRPSIFDTRFIGNGIVGKEWELNKKKAKPKFFNANISVTYTGARYYTPINLQLAIDSGVIEFDYLNPNTARQDPLLFFDISLVYRINKARSSSQLSLQARNIFNQRPLTRQIFNRETLELTDIYGTGFVPVLAWKIQF